ncbi:MAG: RHS repeat-associated core domain-containing protein [Clostridia bacterium]|nr:RHS repeat-associated core domain-containing protein [Clostridia bacterium]
MLSVNINGENRSFVYDSANRLLSAGSHTYTYNAEDLRIRAVRNTVETTYTYNPHARLSQLLMKSLGNEVTKYVYGLGLIGEEVGAVYRTYHFDYRGSTVALTDASGVITDTFEYDTYGKVASRTGTTTTPFLYNGRDGVMTESNGLYYMRARYYSPDLRRFINADIIPGELSNAVTLNRYAYANANPAMFIDPLGLSADGGSGFWGDIGNEITDFVKHSVDVIKDTLYGLYYNATEWHFEGREAKNTPIPTYAEVTSEASEWIKVPQDQTKYHDNGIGKPEEKYTHSDGREVVFDGDTKELITDPKYVGTYNYCVRYQLPEDPSFIDHAKYYVTSAGHQVVDVWPYKLTGESNTREQFEAQHPILFG